ncbi:hypothetical protein C7S20_16680 [Christiangramia fulva]|uniref:GOLD domain-containing protein n=1 Tax=Christiangramia fulva TaxID=2126553 RepID=A0A2R3Z971_9FLAO|nr:hypothetical protein [Christiangramia fulva]AVR46764.1 hypothetical protein C7S20_16680 [Christiangramia fulva]
MKKRNILILFLSIFFFIACSEDDNEEECINYDDVAKVTNVEAPATATVNEVVSVNVTFQVKNACGEFAQFDESIDGTTRTIAVEAVYEGCACAQVITTKTATYEFTPEVTGEYVLKFQTAPNEFIEKTITVEEAGSSS